MSRWVLKMIRILCSYEYKNWELVWLLQSLLCCSIFWVSNLNKMLSSGIISASSLHENGHEFPVAASGLSVNSGPEVKQFQWERLLWAATYWQLLQCVKVFCLSSDTLPVFWVDHHVSEYLDGYCQPVEERWTSSPPGKGRNVASNRLSSPAIIYF